MNLVGKRVEPKRSKTIHKLQEVVLPVSIENTYRARRTILFYKTLVKAAIHDR